MSNSESLQSTQVECFIPHWRSCPWFSSCWGWKCTWRTSKGTTMPNWSVLCDGTESLNWHEQETVCPDNLWLAWTPRVTSISEGLLIRWHSPQCSLDYAHWESETERWACVCGYEQRSPLNSFSPQSLFHMAQAGSWEKLSTQNPVLLDGPARGALFSSGSLCLIYGLETNILSLQQRGRKCYATDFTLTITILNKFNLAL